MAKQDIIAGERAEIVAWSSYRRRGGGAEARPQRRVVERPGVASRAGP